MSGLRWWSRCAAWNHCAGRRWSLRGASVRTATERAESICTSGCIGSAPTLSEGRVRPVKANYSSASEWGDGGASACSWTVVCSGGCPSAARKLCCSLHCRAARRDGVADDGARNPDRSTAWRSPRCFGWRAGWRWGRNGIGGDEHCGYLTDDFAGVRYTVHGTGSELAWRSRKHTGSASASAATTGAPSSY